MTKIVYNGTYGGFSLSDLAKDRFCELKGWQVWKEKDKWSLGGLTYYLDPPEAEDRKVFRDRELDRDDPTLIQVVEELGDTANGRFAQLVIQDILAGTKYRIQEYDGAEWIETESDIEWKVA